MTPPHVLIVTFNSQGHINPSLRLANRLASSGLLVTVSSTSDVASKLHATNPAFTGGEPVRVGKGWVRFEFFSDGWRVSDPRRKQVGEYLEHLRMVGSREVEKMVGRMTAEGRGVHLVVGNPFMPWVVDVGVRLGVPVGVLWVQSCAVFALYRREHVIRSAGGIESAADNPDPEDQKQDMVRLPGMPPLVRADLPSFLLPNSIYDEVANEILGQFDNLSKATFVLVNSFDSLESDVIKALYPEKRLIPVGPLVDLPNASESLEVKADLYEIPTDCIKWLDRQKPNSVVYVSVGSVVEMTKEEMEEMAWGLRSCEKPFLWVVREETRPLLPVGFLDAVEGQGLIVKWCLQNEVLNHPSIECFLTHCGWNSTLETIVAGVPVIAFPHWGDQPTNAKFLVDVYGVGVYLGLEKVENSASYFTREDLKRSVTAVTQGKGAEDIKTNARFWKEAALAAIAEGGSSNRNIQAFLEEVGGFGSTFYARGF